MILELKRFATVHFLKRIKLLYISPLKGFRKRVVSDFSINMPPLTGLSSTNWLKIEPRSGAMFIEREFHALSNPFRGGMLAGSEKVSGSKSTRE